MADGDNANIHAGHRARMRERFRANELDGFSGHEILEFLLFFAIPRGDVNALAHRLLDRFGSLQGVFETSFEELTKVDGIGENAATLMKLIPPLTRAYQLAKASEPQSFDSIVKIADYLAPNFFGRRNEVLYVMCLDGMLRLISCKQISEGSIDGVSFDMRLIIDEVMRRDAKSVVIAHNHPGSAAIPSDADIAQTRSLDEILSALRVRLIDHLIFLDEMIDGDSRCDFVSMADSHYI